MIREEEEKAEEGDTGETIQKQPSAETDESTGNVPENSKSGQVWWIIAALLLTAVIGTGMILIVKKKGEDENSGR